MGISRQTGLGARRPIKHPRRNLQPTLQIGAGNIAPEHQAARPIDRRVNCDPKTRPRMKAVEQIPKLGPVGVLKSCSITRFVRTRLSDIVHPVSSLQLTDLDRVRSFGGYNSRRLPPDAASLSGNCFRRPMVVDGTLIKPKR